MSGEVLRTGGFLTAAAGSVVGMAAAILVATSYHPFTISGFLGHLTSLVGRLVILDFRGWKNEIETAIEVSREKDENRTNLFAGLYLLFLAFLLELAGATAMFLGS